jgi:hypothetical protein
MGYQNPQYGNTNFYGPLSNMREEDKNQAFGNEFGNNRITAAKGSFKNNDTLNKIGKVAVTTAASAYAGPAAGMAAGMAYDAVSPSQAGTETFGTSGFGDQPGKGSATGGGTQKQGNGVNLSNAIGQVAISEYGKYQAKQKAIEEASKQAGPLAEEGVSKAAEDLTSKTTEDAVTEGVDNSATYAKAALDVASILSESGVAPTDAPVAPTINMDTSGVNMANNRVVGPLGKKNLEEDEDPYNKNMSAFAPLGGNYA